MYSYMQIAQELKKILLNFISNTVKFTRHGSIETNSDVINDGRDLVISVQYTGMGIKNEDNNKVFNEETMLESHLYFNKKGSGLGLSISKYIADQMRFQLQFVSLMSKVLASS